MKPKHNPPQFELPTAGEIFNLVSEETVDCQRLQCEAEAAAQQAREAKEIERRRQPEFL